MVSPLSSIRVNSAQLLVKTLNEEATQAQSKSATKRSSLLASYGVETSSSSTVSSKTLASLMETLSGKTGTASSTTTTTTKEQTSGDITTASFMSGLKDLLKETIDAPGGSSQAEAMLAALKAGTLTVTDPTSGVAITAWDVDSEKDKNIKSKPGTNIESSSWSEFLKEHLTRGENSTYTRTADGSYIDKVTKQNAWFGTVGSSYYYLSWTQPKAVG